MKKSIAPFLVLIVLAAVACNKGREGSAAGKGEPTETIAPANPQPDPTGTDAMTQTVDVEGGRSEAEGGGLTSPNPPVSTATDSAGTTAAAGTAATGTATQTTTR